MVQKTGHRACGRGIRRKATVFSQVGEKDLMPGEIIPAAFRFVIFFIPVTR